MPNCEMPQCLMPASSRIHYGMFAPYTRHSVVMCSRDAGELWDRMRAACSAGLGHWSQERLVVFDRAPSLFERLNYIAHELCDMRWPPLTYKRTRCKWSDLVNVWHESRVLRPG